MPHGSTCCRKVAAFTGLLFRPAPARPCTRRDSATRLTSDRYERPIPSAAARATRRLRACTRSTALLSSDAVRSSENALPCALGPVKRQGRRSWLLVEHGCQFLRLSNHELLRIVDTQTPAALLGFMPWSHQFPPTIRMPVPAYAETIRVRGRLTRTRMKPVARTRAFSADHFSGACGLTGRSIAGASARCAHRCTTVTHRGPS